MIASSLTWASRSATAAAWARPRSSSGIPGVRPDSAVPVAAVRPCRTTRTRVTHRLYGVLCARVVSALTGRSVMTKLTEPKRHLVARLDRDACRHPPAIQPGSVGRAEVGQQPLLFLGVQPGVPARHAQVGEREIAGHRAADGEPPVRLRRQAQRGSAAAGGRQLGLPLSSQMPRGRSAGLPVTAMLEQAQPLPQHLAAARRLLGYRQVGEEARRARTGPSRSARRPSGTGRSPGSAVPSANRSRSSPIALVAVGIGGAHSVIVVREPVTGRLHTRKYRVDVARRTSSADTGRSTGHRGWPLPGRARRRMP